MYVIRLLYLSRVRSENGTIAAVTSFDCDYDYAISFSASLDNTLTSYPPQTHTQSEVAFSTLTLHLLEPSEGRLILRGPR